MYVLCISSSPVEFWFLATGTLPPNAYVTLAVTNTIYTLTINLIEEVNYGKYICRGQDASDGKYVYFISVAIINRPGIYIIIIMKYYNDMFCIYCNF